MKHSFRTDIQPSFGGFDIHIMFYLGKTAAVDRSGSN